METRAFRRINITLKVISKIDRSLKQRFALSAGESFEGNALDISEIGIGLASKYFLPKGLILEIEIEGAPFGLEESMKLQGEIRYCKFMRTFYRCGVKFLNTPEVYRKAIAQFISTYERREAPRVKLSD